MTLDNFVNSKFNDYNMEIGIRVDCYAAILNKMKSKFPDAHFEIVMRGPQTVGIQCSPSVLSPSWELLKRAKSTHNFEQYKRDLEYQLFNDSNAVRRMHELNRIAQTKLVFLVCSEKNPEECHRSLLKNWIENIEAMWKIWKVRGLVR